MPFGLVLVVLFALAGAAVARRRGWPVILAATASALVPPIGVFAAGLFAVDRVRDAVAAQAGGQAGGQPPGPAAPRGQLPGFPPDATGRPQLPRPPRREAPRDPDPLPPALEDGTVLRALRTHGPMSEQELLAALVDPPSDVRYQLRELQRHAAVAARQGRFVARV